jgi:hypothetical protein
VDAPPPVPGAQRKPAWQLSPGQQAALLPPQAVHMPGPGPGSLQPEPMSQVLFAQQISLRAPHGWQVGAVPGMPSLQRRSP